MNTQAVLPARAAASSRSAAPTSGAYKVDISRGERIGRVSSEWFLRPDDERYLSLGDLYAAVRGRAERATLGDDPLAHVDQGYHRFRRVFIR